MLLIESLIEGLLLSISVPGAGLAVAEFGRVSSETRDGDSLPVLERSTASWCLIEQNEANDGRWELLVFWIFTLWEKEEPCMDRSAIDSDEVRIVGPDRGARPRNGRSDES